jgi:hypothetical protein
MSTSVCVNKICSKYYVHYCSDCLYLTHMRARECVCVCKHTYKGDQLVAQLVNALQALHYKPEICRFSSQWCHWNYCWHNPSNCTMILELTASNRYEYLEYFLGGRGGRWIGLTTLPTSSVKCLEILYPQPPAALRASPDQYRDYFLHIHKTPPFHKWDLLPYSDYRVERHQPSSSNSKHYARSLDR